MTAEDDLVAAVSHFAGSGPDTSWNRAAKISATARRVLKARSMREEVWGGLPQPAVGGYGAAGTCQDPL